VQADSTVVIRNVQIGTTEGGMAEITSGVQSGDVVVLSGADKLEQGTRVSAQIPEEDTGQKSGQKPGQNTSSGSRSKKRP
jgi:membrane fusion protein, multidrug efflux system